MGNSDIGVVINSDTLTAATVLYREQVINKDLAFAILKKYIEKAVSADVTIPINIEEDASNKLSMNPYIKIISLGESETIEFKESWRYDIHQKILNNDLRVEVLKTIAAFMNSDGGRLFIGIKDNGELTDLRQTEGTLIVKSKILKDELRKQIDDAIGDRLGNSSFHWISKIFFEEIDGKLIAIIDVSRANTEVWLDKKHFYIRRSASSIELEGPDFSNYIRNRFKKY